MRLITDRVACLGIDLLISSTRREPLEAPFLGPLSGMSTIRSELWFMPFPRIARDTTKWIEVTSQKGVSSTATASAQFAGRAVQLSRNVRQSDHIFVNEIAGHKVKRGPGAGEEWLAATKHDGVDVESILVNQTQVR